VAINIEHGQVAEMLAWALSIMDSRDPDFTIEDGDKTPYMDRWFVVPRNPAGGVYIHRILRSDKDVPHDHPWDFTSYVLQGGYTEERPGLPEQWRGPGTMIHRRATDAHRLILSPGEIAITVCFLGPWQRDWGFHCPKGWVDWRTFCDGEDHGRVGRGCGEMA